MNTIERGPLVDLGRNENGLSLRNQEDSEQRKWRGLTTDERRTLESNRNTADSWDNFLVTDGFNPDLVRDSSFYGINRVAAIPSEFYGFHDLRVPNGITNSTIVSCDIGDGCAVHHVHHLSNYVIGNNVMLFNIDEMLTTNYAKFGNGIVKEGENEEVRIWIEVANENAGRRILPFDGLTPADAYLWSHSKDNPKVQRRLEAMTEKLTDKRRGYYGTVGDCTVIKSCRIIKDVKFGEHAYVKGANKLKNLTIKSRSGASTQIGEGVELVNGIVEVGCRIFYGVKAVRFCLRTNASLKYGARLINSILGDNGTISCCEVLNSIVYPSHEQHHNNSFLVAATVQGQSNIAAGATLGSNHNSRANDGEIFAKRGFWPGLCVNLKHSSRFASFCLIAKGSYPAELNIELPFTLVSNDDVRNTLNLMPGYWFLYNMYALARNSWKYNSRDARLYSDQIFEYDFLAPDTAEELLNGIEILEFYAGHYGSGESIEKKKAIERGRTLLAGDTLPDDLPLRAPGIEASGREIVLLKIKDGYNIYMDMVHYYGIKSIAHHASQAGISALAELVETFSGASRCPWVNLGGQLIREEKYRSILSSLESGTIDSWDGLHGEYQSAAAVYPQEKAAHGFASLLSLHRISPKDLDSGTWNAWIDRGISIQKSILDRARTSREKDYQNQFKRMMFETDSEMNAVIGALEENSFISDLDEETQMVVELLDSCRL